MNLRLILVLIGLLMVISALTVLPACSPEQPPNSADSTSSSLQWRLPDYLREVSGLAVADDSHLYLMNDEEGIVYRFNLESGEVTRSLEVGPAADYEGIEVLEGKLYLVTSNGMLYARHIDTSALSVSDTGLNKTCEVEGLHSEAQDLLLLCKTIYDSKLEDGLLIYRFDPKIGKSILFLKIMPEQLSENFSTGLNPSAMTTVRTVDGLKILILAARQKRLLVIERTSETEFELTAVHKLRGHRQAEGIAVLGNKVVVADEGKNKGGKITIYTSILDIDA